MPARIGIPRALLYYYYYPMWSTFFNEIGANVVVSGKTTKAALDAGVKNCVDEACLPIKLAFGHVLELADKVDYIFLPRMVSISNKEYICPKFLGFPDMVKRACQKLPPVIDVNIDLYKSNRDMLRAFNETAGLFTRNPARIFLAYRRAVARHREYTGLLERGYLPDEAMQMLRENQLTRDYLKINTTSQDTTVAVLGHPYNIYDHYISMNLLKRLRDKGVRVLTSDNISEQAVREEATKLPKRLFWTLGQRMMGAAFYFMDYPGISGIIHVASFACGPDSMTGELIERNIRNNSNIPFLNLNLDEHTGEAGVVTRLEAFLDMMQRRRAGILAEVH